MIGDEHFGQMILPWRLCLHASKPTWYFRYCGSGCHGGWCRRV